MVKFFVGLDLGQANDYTALAVLEKKNDGRENIYHIRRLERTKGAPYPDIVDKVAAMLRSSPLAGNAVLIVDQTGVGAPVVDLFKKAGLKPVGILIHGGDKATREGMTLRTPKRDLVGTLQVLLQNGRLKISWKLKLAQVLSGEMLNFKVKINQSTAHDSYSAWREEDHDDLLLAVAMAAWYGERARRSFKVPSVASTWRTETDAALEDANASLGLGVDRDEGSWLQANPDGSIRMTR
jgi:hypothetical protein